jgi:hypothetical protein
MQELFFQPGEDHQETPSSVEDRLAIDSQGSASSVMTLYNKSISYYDNIL